MILEKINKPNDIKKLSPIEYNQLADEIRQFLIDKISVTGGHLASNLGVVELTMALHIVFNLPKDKLIWDVGHQSYTHKILTGRKNQFDELRKLKVITMLLIQVTARHQYQQDLELLWQEMYSTKITV